MPDAPRLTFPQSYRLKTPAQFKAVYDLKKSASDGLLIVYAGPNGLPHPRLGVSVSKKVGPAHVRNRFKRLFREAFRRTQHDLPPGVDLILIPRPPAKEPALDYLLAALPKLARQAVKKLAAPPPPPAEAPP